jgi:hypothetical protein
MNFKIVFDWELKVADKLWQLLSGYGAAKVASAGSFPVRGQPFFGTRHC